MVAFAWVGCDSSLPRPPALGKRKCIRLHCGSKMRNARRVARFDVPKSLRPSWPALDFLFRAVLASRSPGSRLEQGNHAGCRGGASVPKLSQPACGDPIPEHTPRLLVPRGASSDVPPQVHRRGREQSSIHLPQVACDGGTEGHVRHDVPLDVDPRRDLEQLEAVRADPEHRALGDEDGLPALGARERSIVADLLDLLDELHGCALPAESSVGHRRSEFGGRPP